jgi:transcriptional regulator with GAF, ATPase, and Fis domain
MDELNIQVQKALKHNNLLNEVDYLRHARANVIYNFGNIIGNSKKVREIFSILEKIAKTDTTVLIYGESGTGKELVAGAIHYNSLRSEEAFVKVNCAALPENLLESELFGHERGAFTGADKQRVGRCEQANRGTLFLDEISELPLKTQGKLLRFLQEKEIQRLGSSQTIRVDARLISATNKNLQDEIRAGRFREDLYYRLNVVPIEIPPLRHRDDDVLALADYFLKYYCRELNRKVTGFDDEALKAMLSYRWPGNVRELKNSVERAMLMGDGDKITLKDMVLSLSNGRDSIELRLPVKGFSLAEVEKSTIIKALEASRWVQKDAAELLGVSKRALNYKIENFQIKNPRWIKNR